MATLTLFNIQPAELVRIMSSVRNHVSDAGARCDMAAEPGRVRVRILAEDGGADAIADDIAGWYARWRLHLDAPRRMAA